MNKKLNGYKGRLSAKQIADGMNAAKQNAERLMVDAEILMKNRRFPSAASLAILSIEESGKVSILRSLVLARDDKEVSTCWRNYRSHTKKNVAWLLPQLVAEGARKLEDFRSLFDEKSDHPFILDQVKQLGFYTDCLGAAHWSLPEEVIDETLAVNLVQTARLFSKNGETTTKEIDLWVNHLRPVWMRDMTLMKKAIAAWHAEMQQLGLAPEGENKMEKFISVGLDDNLKPAE